MEIKDIKARSGQIDIVFTVVSKEQPRTFEKFGKPGKVCNAKIKDASGEILLTLWNEQIEALEVGDKVHLTNGWCSEYRDERQLSTGKFGKLDVIEKGSPLIVTNDPERLAKVRSVESSDEAEEEEPELIEAEEFIEEE